MNILALETATEACSVAILSSSGEIVSDFEIAPRRHTELLPRMLDSVLSRAGIVRNDVGCIAFGNGPGAFTGVRIAAATAQGMSMGLGVPLIPVSTLAVLAQTAFDRLGDGIGRVQAVVDARMGEIYSGVYSRDACSGLASAENEEVLVAAGEIEWSAGTIVGSGLGAAEQAGMIPDAGCSCDSGMLPHAAALARLANAVFESGSALSPDKVEINYLRNQVAWRN